MNRSFVDDRFGGSEVVTVDFPHYHNGRVAIQLNALNGEPYLRASINIPDSEVMEKIESENSDGVVAIKDYSENQGMTRLLSKNGVIELAPLAIIRTGFISVPIYRLTPEALLLANSEVECSVA